jgi:hypothetical protein
LKIPEKMEEDADVNKGKWVKYGFRNCGKGRRMLTALITDNAYDVMTFR